VHGRNEFLRSLPAFGRAVAKDKIIRDLKRYFDVL
jgi:hypothetical protein